MDLRGAAGGAMAAPVTGHGCARGGGRARAARAEGSARAAPWTAQKLCSMEEGATALEGGATFARMDEGAIGDGGPKP